MLSGFVHNTKILLTDLLGLKGANLCEMHRIGLPVPPAFTITSKCSLRYHNEQELTKTFIEELKYAVGKLESKTGKKFGNVSGDQKPLLLSVRSSSVIAMPGMMTTVLNLGMNKMVVQALTEQSNDGRWALTTYMKFLESFGVHVNNVHPDRYQEVKQEVLNRKPAPLESLLTVQDLQDIIDKFKLVAPIPGDPWEQLTHCIEAAFKAWYSPTAVKYRDVHNIPEDRGAAVTVQAMVFGNTNQLSGAGQACTRSPDTGEKKLCGSYLGHAEASALAVCPIVVLCKGAVIIRRLQW
jgi:pyruvate,orthophosphate dikinase